MNTLCGIGLPELILLLLVAFVVVGPERSREAAVSIGRLLGKVLRSQWWKELSEISQSLRNLPETLVRMAELEDVQSELREAITDIQASTKLDDESKKRLADIEDTLTRDPAQDDNKPTPDQDQTADSSQTQQDGTEDHS